MLALLYSCKLCERRRKAEVEVASLRVTEGIGDGLRR